MLFVVLSAPHAGPLMRIPTLIATALTLGASPAASQAPAADSAAPELQLRVSVEQGALRAGERTTLNVWILNPSGRPVPGARLYVDAPAFLAVLAAGCARRAPLPLPLDTLRPGELRTLSLCIRAGDEANRIREGEAKLSVLLYATGAWGKQRARWVAADQPIKVGLFGTDEVAGVSLSLIALFVPGALLLAFLRVSAPRDLKWLAGLATAEQALLAVLLSLLLAWARNEGGPALIGYRDFFALAGIGALLGFAIRAPFQVDDYQRARERDRLEKRRAELEALVPVEGEPLQTTIRKLIQQSGEVENPRSEIVTYEGKRIIGSLAAQYADGAWVVIGRFGLNRDGVDAETLAKAATAGQLALARLVEKEMLTLDEKDRVLDEQEDYLEERVWTRGTAISANVAGKGRGPVLSLT
jgi:hypothetical protein